MKKLIITTLLAFGAIASPVVAQSEVLCARHAVNVRGIVSIPIKQSPILTLIKYPPLERPIIDVIPAQSCVVTKPNPKTYWVDGREWVLITEPDYKGWVAKDLFE